MIDYFGLTVSFCAAAILVVALVPLTMRLAVRWGAVDRPDGYRKNQAAPVPSSGGIAVAVAAAIALLFALWPSGALDPAVSPWLIKGFVPAVAILLIVGIVDDFATITGIYKLLGQVLSVSILVAAGGHFDRISLFGMAVPLGGLQIPFTIFFCLGAINAFNLIDGVDALASSVGAIVCLTLGVITAAQGHAAAAAVCFALAGALVGFLRYNRAPAKVYLGDTGSMLIGLVVAAIAIMSSIKQQAAFALAVPLAICAIPILDAGAALIRRVTTGQSVFTADRGHLHHALLLRGWSATKTVVVIASLTALTCASALLSFFTNQDAFALVVSGGVFLVLAATRVFGHAEAALLAKRSISVGRKLLSRGARRPAPAMEHSFQIQGSRKWQNLWSGLRESAPRYNLTKVTLQINIPYLHESFFANWTSDGHDQRSQTWRLAFPLTHSQRPIGKLSLVGSTSGRQALCDMNELMDVLDNLHDEIATLITVNPEPANCLATPDLQLSHAFQLAAAE